MGKLVIYTQLLWSFITFKFVSKIFKFNQQQPAFDLDELVDIPDDLKRNSKNDISKKENYYVQELLNVDKVSKWNIIKSTFFCYKKLYTKYILIFPFNVLFAMLLPILLTETLKIIESFQDLTSVLWTIALLCFVLLIRGVLDSHSVFALLRTKTFARRLLALAIIKKSTRLGGRSFYDGEDGQVQNLVHADTEPAVSMMMGLLSVLRITAILLTSILLLFNELGHTAWWGLSGLLLSTLVSTYLHKRMMHKKEKLHYQADERLSILSELFRKFRQVRMSSLTPFFKDKTSDLHRKELVTLKKYHILHSLNQLATLSTPLLMSIVTFSVLLGEGQALSIAGVFTTISLFTLIRPYINSLGSEVSSIIASVIALKRIANFLNRSEYSIELDDKNLSLGAVDIRSLALSSHHQSVLSNINLSVKPGEIIAVIGETGAGKTALFNTIAGYDNTFSGQVARCGRVSYLQHYMWLVNDTLRNNITFGDEFDQARYEHVLEVCQLIPDITALSHGDQTLVGELGIRLSGGQQQRVALARALYSQANILLLDNPMSALDPLVAKAIFQQAILPTHNSRIVQTRLLITHDTRVMSQCDRVFKIQDTHLVEVDKASLVHSEPLDSAEAVIPQDDDYQEHKAEQHEQEVISDSHYQGSLLKELLRQAGGPYFLGFILVLLILFEGLRIGSELWLGAQSQLAPGDISAFLHQYWLLAGASLLVFFTVLICELISMLKVSRNGHAALLNGVIQAPMSFFDRVPQGRIVNRFGTDLSVYTLFLSKLAVATALTLVSLLAQIILIIWNMPLIVPLFLVIYRGYWRVQSTYQYNITRVRRRLSLEMSKTYTLLGEAVRGAHAIRLNHKVDYTLNRLMDQLEKRTRARYTVDCIRAWLILRLAILSVLAVGVTSVLVVTLSDSHLIMTIAITYAVLMNGMINSLITNLDGLDRTMLSAWRVAEYSVLKSENSYESELERVNANFHSSSGSLAKINPLLTPFINQVVQSKSTHDISTDKVDLYSKPSTLQFNRVNLVYPNAEEAAIKDIDLVIEPGQRVGVCGRSGSGKSSLISALLGVYPLHSGDIILGDQSLSQLALEDRRKIFSTITQTPLLFSGSLRENIDPHQQFSDSEVDAVLQAVGLITRVQGLTRGLYTDIQTTELSAGESQLIVLSRTLLDGRGIVLLDEAVSDLDYELMQFISSQLLIHKVNATLISIAHHLQPLLSMNRVVVMDQGRIVQVGSPQDLMSDKNGHFYSLFHQQIVALGNKLDA